MCMKSCERSKGEMKMLVGAGFGNDEWYVQSLLLAFTSFQILHRSRLYLHFCMYLYHRGINLICDLMREGLPMFPQLEMILLCVLFKIELKFII